MHKTKKFISILILMTMVFFLSGCAILQLPFTFLGGLSKLIPPLMSVAKKVPWWMAL